MKSIWIMFLTVFVVPLAQATTSTDMCEILLHIPKQFHGAFEQYNDARFLQRPDRLSIVFEDPFHGKDIHRVSLEAGTDSSRFSEETKITSTIMYDQKRQSISLTRLSISKQFSEEYGIKLFLAAYLDRFPKIRSVRFVIFETLPISFSILRENLAKGESLETAFVSTPLSKALESLGFVKGEALKFFLSPGADDTTPSTFQVQVKMSRID